jgi:outer membrane protein assembly factor BamA
MIFSSVGLLHAQSNKGVSIPQLVKGKKEAADTLIINSKTADQKDVSDVLRSAFHIKPAPNVDSITTKPEISVVPALGYTLVSKLAVVLSGNVAFRTGPQSRISTIVASASYTQNKQFIIPVQTNFWTKNNSFEFIGDYRFYKYPESTYGLGSSSSIHNEDPMDFSFARFYETVLKHLFANWFGGVGYAIDNYWNISQKGTLNGAPSDFARYDASAHTIASGVTVNMLHDSRDNSINPAKGWYGSIQYRTNMRMLGSTASFQSLILDFRKYIRFPANSDNVLALWTYDWFTLHGNPPYLSLPSTSWDPNSATGRGYIQGRYRGAQMVYAESEYRFKITQNGLLGGVVFVNAQSLSAQTGTKLQAIQPGFGPGLRLKLNKTSNTNIAIDYGFGNHGSKGLFIDVGEIF